MTEPTDDWDVILEAWRKALGPFVDGSKTAAPDVKLLAGLLRSTVPMPDDFRNILADLLDTPLLPRIVCNWQLRPHFTGGRDKEAVRIERERQINDMVDKRQGSSTEAIADAAEAIGVCEKTAWDVLRKQNQRVAQWRDLLNRVAPMTDEQRAAFLEAIRRQ
jgi:hypothetical protein